MHCTRGSSCNDHVATIYWSRDWSCTDHVNDHALFPRLIMYWSRDWSRTDHVAIMLCSRGWSCSDHVATMYWSREWSCTDHVIDHALIFQGLGSGHNSENHSGTAYHRWWYIITPAYTILVNSTMELLSNFTQLSHLCPLELLLCTERLLLTTATKYMGWEGVTERQRGHRQWPWCSSVSLMLGMSVG